MSLVASEVAFFYDAKETDYDVNKFLNLGFKAVQKTALL